MSSKFCIEKFQINLSDLKIIKETLSIVMVFIEVVFVLFYKKNAAIELILIILIICP